MTGWSISTVTRSPAGAELSGFADCWRRARQEPDCCSCFCFLLFLQSRSGGTILIGVGERLRADAAVRKKEGRRERRENEQNTAIDAGPSLWVCTHVCTRAYIRGLRSLRHGKNTHDATGEAGRRVRVSQSITPLLSLHLSPYVSPASLLLSSSSNSTTVVVPVVMPCLFSKRNPRAKTRLVQGAKKKKKKRFPEDLNISEVVKSYS